MVFSLDDQPKDDVGGHQDAFNAESL